ncbi:MAG: hypothetical protein EBR82_47355 [Caulobacteraceae bacterium]|nr:hypothetical protein [Caulobacteraceae bacterium]
MRHEKAQKEKAIKKAVQRTKKGEKAWKTPSLEMGWKDWGIRVVPKASAKSLPAIKILAERRVTMVELDLDVPDKIHEDMLAYAADYIVSDKKALFNWAFNKALENFVNLKGKK